MTAHENSEVDCSRQSDVVSKLWPMLTPLSHGLFLRDMKSVVVWSIWHAGLPMSRSRSLLIVSGRL